MAKAKNVEEDLEDLEDEFELEIIDDVPPEDQGRPVAPVEASEEEDSDASLGSDEPDEEELKSYSERVRSRINGMSAKYHAERRAKEQLAREMDEAINYGKHIIDENNRLKQLVHHRENAWKDTQTHRLAAEIEQARQSYKAAYEEGDADKVAAAQQRLTELSVQSERVRSWQPRQMQPVQVPQRPQQQAAPQPDEQAVAWAQKNNWFGKDTRMTAYALGVHQELVSNGVDPTSREYYTKIDTEMKKTFPDKFGTPVETSQAKGNGSANVVAPAKREAKSSRNKITLTASQVALAKKLGVSPKAYAEEMLRVEKEDA